MTTLRDLVDRHTAAHAQAEGVALTAVSGLVCIRADRPSGIRHAVARPLVCLVLQGAKQVSTGAQTVAFAEGDSLVISADVPTASRITRAAPDAPYLSISLELDPAVLAELTLGAEGAGLSGGERVQVERTDAETADAALRLMRLLDRPAALPVLHASLVREMHYWLLAGRLGPAIRRLGLPDGHAGRIARAAAVLRTAYARPLRVAELAAAAGMSASSFHQHFKAVTSLSPLQFQKQLRLVEARRLMTAEGASASHAAFAVGYESVPQFTREYGRMYGAPPVRDTRALRAEARAAA